MTVLTESRARERAPGKAYVTSSVVSKDGTRVGYRRLGTGAGVILVHGGMKSSSDFMKLALALASSFTVYVVDRRGRGLSGPHGSGFSVAKEVEDLQAVVAATGAHRIFGLSVGGLVSLRAALSTPELEQVALYEAPLSIQGSAPIGWVDRYQRELSQGATATAVVTAMKGMQVMPMFDRLPRFLLVPLLSLVMRAQGEGTPEEVPIRLLVPTLRFDVQIVKELSDTLPDYRKLAARILLLGGTASPGYLGVSLDALEGALPHVQRLTFPGLGHDGPEDDGQPELVAERLRQFFA